VKLWDATAGKEIRSLQGHGDWVNSVAFSPDGTRLASASNDQTVKLWDVKSGVEVLTLRGHVVYVFGVAFSPDGTRLASIDGLGGLKVWDARPWTPEEGTEEREALGLLSFLFAKPLRRADVLDSLRHVPTHRPQVRQQALSLVDRYHEETNPETYHQASWALLRQRDAGGRQAAAGNAVKPCKRLRVKQGRPLRRFAALWSVRIFGIAEDSSNSTNTRGFSIEQAVAQNPQKAILATFLKARLLNGFCHSGSRF
jgi:WD domain, G-beta repeat